MAKIVLGMGASHGPLLATPPEQWGGRVEADRRNPALAYRDGTFKFDELAKLRAKENLEQQIELPVKQKRYDACQRAMAEMARVFKEVKPDVAVLVGNDQMEVFEDANIPAFLVCFGETVDNIPFSEEQKKRLPPGIEIAEPNHHGKTAQSYPGHPELGRHLIETLVQSRLRRRRGGAAAAIHDVEHFGAAARLRLHLPPHHAGELCAGGAVLHQHVLSPRTSRACGDASLWARRWRRRSPPGTRICVSRLSPPAACRISWWTRRSTAASSTP